MSTDAYEVFLKQTAFSDYGGVEGCLFLKVIADTPLGMSERLRGIRALGPQVTTRTTVVLQTHFDKPSPSPFLVAPPI